MSFSTRRTFLAYAGAAVLAPSARSQKRAPVGLMAYAMRQELENDMAAALKAIAKMGTLFLLDSRIRERSQGADG